MDKQTKEQANMLVPEQIPSVEPVPYSQEEVSVRADYIRRMQLARFEREMQHPELDMMTYLEYHESNRKKDLSFLRPKKHANDIRIVTGTTREKDSTLLSTLLNMNVQPEIQAFDKDNMFVAELGSNMSDLVKKSLQIEDWEKKRPIVYREMIAQGDVFVQDIQCEKFQEIPIEDLNWDPSKDGISDFSMKYRLQKVYSGRERRMVSGKKIYLGSIRIPYVEDQDIVFVLNIYSRDKAQQIYGTWERWKYVPWQITATNETFQDDGKLYHDWNLTTVPYNKVAEIMIYNKAKNRFQIMLNGVMMMPTNYPLTAISPTSDIPMAQGKLEPISDFAYSKGQPSKTKIQQEVLDMATTLIIEKMQQGAKPTMGSRSKKMYGPSIYSPGKVVHDIGSGDLFPLFKDTQMGMLTNADFSFYSLFKTQIEENTINSTYEGNTPDGNPTATQINAEKQQQLLKLGSALDALINLERRMTWLTIYNLIHYGMNPTDTKVDKVTGGLKDVYEQMSVETTLSDGDNGIKVFKMADTYDFPLEADQDEENRKLTKTTGKKHEVVYLDPKLLKTLKYYWYIVINPTPRTDDKLSQVLFVQNMQTAASLFGIDSLNLDYLKQRFAMITKEDYNKYFKKVDVMQMLQQKQQQQMGAQQQKGNPRDMLTPGRMASNQPLSVGLA